ncbi:ABC transporter ATP-binding protein [Thermospira aquatica]|uniref:ABC transporter ATP-binding protein n=1 Tax=Thermospira aquatica TaxID=2828656 RepID=A0AAX3BFU6_9SPIR|nr:ABC transporter ATP-binding protein [Thermospira aquatica]URA11003.1 ABC transporter ATP-binding protein [Thermospira aquatica]
MRLRIQDVKKTYMVESVGVPALRGVTLEVDEGEFMAIAGPSGSGKTTLLNLISAIDNYDEGEMWYDDRCTKNLSEEELRLLRRDSLGFIFQNYNLIPVLTVYENVEYPLWLDQELPPEEKRKSQVMKMLESVGLKEYASRYPGQLSGGQKQRVAIARALVRQPKLILADEPTANLDSKTAHQIIELLRECNRVMGVTVIFSTHDNRILDVVDRVVHLEDGIITKDERKEA